MKHIFKLFGFGLLIIMMAQSCSKNDFNINKNPNNPTDSTVSYNVVLPAALATTARVVTRSWGYTLQSWLGYYARSGGYAPNTDLESYQARVSDGQFSQVWTNMYDNLYDYQTVLLGAQKAGADFYSGIARIMKAHNFAILVDLYNNIPYSTALKGAANTTPVYDKGADIYKDLLKQIDTGIALIRDANASADGVNKNIGRDDVMFGTTQYAAITIANQKLKWQAFGNTLKLRLLSHLLNGGIETVANPNPATQVVPGFNINAELAQIGVNGGGFLTEDAMVNPGYSATKPNPFFDFYIKTTAGAATQANAYLKGNSYAIGNDTKLGYYPNDGDPRIDKFYAAPSGGQRGVDYGLASTTDNAGATLSSVSPTLRTVTSGVWIITKAESYFLQAEFVQRGYVLPGAPGTAASLLQTAIESSFVSLGLSVADATAYITGNATYPDVDINGTYLTYKGGVHTILAQKWFALNGIAPFEVFSDYRRGDFDATTKHFVYGVGGGYDPGPPISVYQFNTSNHIPLRYPYPQSEFNYNPGNVSAEGTIDPLVNRVFWDLN